MFDIQKNAFLWKHRPPLSRFIEDFVRDIHRHTLKKETSHVRGRKVDITQEWPPALGGPSSDRRVHPST